MNRALPGRSRGSPEKIAHSSEKMALAKAGEAFSKE